MQNCGITLTRIQNGRLDRRSDKRKHVKFLVKQTVYKDFMEENQPQKVNSKSINTIKILICPV
jgi:GMP synthase PP-ATPase subunit